MMKTLTRILMIVLLLATCVALGPAGCGSPEREASAPAQSDAYGTPGTPDARTTRRPPGARASRAEDVVERQGLRTYMMQAGARPGAAVASYIAPDEELWIIARHDAPAAGAVADDEGPGCGALLCRPPASTPDAPVDVPLPLEHTSVDAEVTGYIASVTVSQRFHNPYDGKIEAVYVFPLPHNAAVNEFVMTIGERRIRGIIRERQEAERIYYEARRQGYVASLLTQERPNVFTQRVANIEPGRSIDVDISYFNTLAYGDGWFEFAFPMVVGPRYNPPGVTGGIGAVPRGAAGAAGSGTAVSYLRPEERSGHDIDLNLTLDAGVAIEEIACRSHVIDEATPGSAQRRISLRSTDRIPNRDFVLRYRVAGSAPKGSLLTHRDERGGYFTFMLYPPAEMRDVERAPIEMVFVIDCSGSMKGEPLALARRAVARALQRLEPEDTFQVIRFSEDPSMFGQRPVPATARNVRDGLRFVDRLNAKGGTRMNEAVFAALGGERDSERVRYVTFMTDGFIGNEAQVLETVRARLGDARIFSFGIGSAPNRYLLEGLAVAGRGAVAYVGLNDSPADVIDHYVTRIAHPALTDLTLDFGDLDVRDVSPARLPDLLVGRPVIVSGRFDGAMPGPITARGRVVGEEMAISVPVRIDELQTPRPALPLVWARRRMAELAASRVHGPGDAEAEIRGLALEYGLMSDYTAFIAVDSSRITEGAAGTTVPVAVPVPAGVRYETTVNGAGG
ncbi:MAG: VWA domain-containing protein [Planctomycetes bacterium]|nr:VWA domain-containing protein [Planctomycetota bacterium]